MHGKSGDFSVVEHSLPQGRRIVASAVPSDPRAATGELDDAPLTLSRDDSGRTRF